MQSFSQIDSKGIPFDKKLDTLFKYKENGFYIELGANNGLEQSNTAYFEFFRNWKGILIEPSPEMYQKCKENRLMSSCYNYACVSSSYTGEYVEGDFDGSLMASVGGIRNGRCANIRVKAKSLENIIIESGYTGPIDLLSLDTEGYELPILEGLNLKRFRPKYMLIEIYTKDYDTIYNYLQDNNYKLVDCMSNYNRIDSPNWDGTHNDYLFLDTLATF
jgi:FkbM family methyltransferase